MHITCCIVVFQWQQVCTMSAAGLHHDCSRSEKSVRTGDAAQRVRPIPVAGTLPQIGPATVSAWTRDIHCWYLRQ